jgi:Domain of Unknown Function with PDB structure (DUF3857)
VQDLTSEIARNAPFYTDLHEKHVAVKGLSVGDTLEYATSSKLTKPYAEGQFWSAFNFSRGIALHEQFLVDVPKARPVKFLSLGLRRKSSTLGTVASTNSPAPTCTKTTRKNSTPEMLLLPTSS